ncbi:MAG: outer membrane beta-barrel protein, partial [Treponema sp.]|nr:outer membrane beta-barrel protein [Treponema sp.]
RIFVGLVLAAFTAAGAFAAPEFKLSAGAGGYFTSDFGGGYKVSAKLPAGLGNLIQEEKTPYAGGGGFVFIDATYAELSFGFFGGGGKSIDKREMPAIAGGNSEHKFTTSTAGLDIGLLGKYPFEISEKLSVFPLLGITYRVVISEKMEKLKYGKPGDFSALWFNLGGGLDFSLTDQLYLRSELLYGLRTGNTYEKNRISAAEKEVKSHTLTPDSKASLGHGLSVKLAVGYRL